MARVRAVYDRLKINAELAPFFSDLPARLASSHLVVSRSGAGTWPNSLRSAGPRSWCRCWRNRPDQFAMPACWPRSKAPLRIAQAEFTPDRLASEISAFAAEPAKLTAMAAAARTVGRLDAAERLPIWWKSCRNSGQIVRTCVFLRHGRACPAIHVLNKSATSKNVDARTGPA